MNEKTKVIDSLRRKLMNNFQSYPEIDNKRDELLIFVFENKIE
jgi:hypothetical protein